VFHHNPARPASPAQLERLRELGVAPPESLNSYEADLLIKARHDRWAALPATPRQERYLRRRGRWRDGMRRGAAAELIRDLKGGSDWPLGPEQG